MQLSNNQQVFLELVRAGLWEKEARLSHYDNLDFNEVYRLAEEQSVLGLVAAGIEHVIDKKVPQEMALSFVGPALQLEQRNTAMNDFVAKLVEQLRIADVYAILVKGQGIAQCYERPLWRSSGDVDFFLSDNNYIRAKMLLEPISTETGLIDTYRKHILFVINNWHVELHGNLRSNLWKKVDHVLDEVQNDVFCGGAVRTWINGQTQIFLPRVDEDVVFVFAHILQHYYKEGVGLRQICDWCRLLYTYKDSVKRDLLGNRLKKMGVMSEWHAFAYLAVNSLGMPEDAMPFYCNNKKWENKANHILNFIFEVGNFGHNIDASYLHESNIFVRKVKTLLRLTGNNLKQIIVFPLDTIRVWCYMFSSRLLLTISKL